MNTETTPHDLALKKAIKILEAIITIDRMPPNRLIIETWKDNILEAQQFVRKWKQPIDRSSNDINNYITPETLVDNLDMSVRLYNVLKWNSERIGLGDWPSNHFPTVEDLSKIRPHKLLKQRNCGKGTMNEMYQIFVKAGMFDVASRWERYSKPNSPTNNQPPKHAKNDLL